MLLAERVKSSQLCEQKELGTFLAWRLGCLLEGNLTSRVFQNVQYILKSDCVLPTNAIPGMSAQTPAAQLWSLKRELHAAACIAPHPSKQHLHGEGAGELGGRMQLIGFFSLIGSLNVTQQKHYRSIYHCLTS